MLLKEFSFELPDELIAQEAAPRGQSRLMVLAGEHPEHRRVADLPELLEPGDLLVVNDTRVLPARLFARRRPGGGGVEVLLFRRLGEREWLALARPGRRAKPGQRLDFDDGLAAEVVDRPASGRYRLRFSEPVEPHLERIGHVPLPPYIKRPDEARDRERYQTVFARVPGAVAAPTAGLHFTPELLARLEERGIETARITLHVGIGTFQPIRAALVHEHRMEEEELEIGPEAAAAIGRAQEGGGRVVAVGTTVVRALESAARAPEGFGPRRGATDLFIYPGFEFRIVDRLLTNFHLPRSSLLLLACAFGGRDRVLAAYREAVRRRYRFYSYGDAMLISPPTRGARGGAITSAATRAPGRGS